jgi:hypothetical protein
LAARKYFYAIELGCEAELAALLNPDIAASSLPDVAVSKERCLAPQRTVFISSYQA